MVNSINLKDFIERISYNKTETYTKTEILDEISRIQLLQVVDSLPTTNIKENKIYLVLNDEDIGDNRYDLYVYVNDNWEQIDSLEFNIEDYPTKTELNYQLSLKSDISHGHENVTAVIDGFMSSEDKVKLDSIDVSDSNPLMNGVVSQGVSTKYSRQDHIHPSDTNKVDKLQSTASMNMVTDSDCNVALEAKNSHSHGQLQSNGQVGNVKQVSKNVVTDSNGLISTEDKYSHPTYTARKGSPTTNQTPSFGGTVTVSQINSDSQGHVTNAIDRTIKIPNNLGDGTNKGLTTNDYTTSEKSKLNGIENNANKYTHPSYTAKSNGLYKVTVDSTGHVSSASSVSASDLPSHEHDTGSVKDTSAYGNIGSSANASQKTINNGINNKLGLKANSSDVYTKSQTLTASEITQAIADGVSNVSLFEVVSSLPTSSIKGNKFYLMSNGESIEDNVYDIYIYVNNDWEQIDSLEFDIDNYYTITQIDALLSGKVDNTDSRLTNARTPTSHSHGNLTNTGAIGSTSGKIITTGSNGVLQASDNIDISKINNFPSTMTPSSHNHGNLTNEGKLGTTANKPVITTTNGAITTGSFESSTSNIKMNGNVSVGSSNNFSRSDHIHPTDTTRVAVSDIKDNLTSSDVDKPLSANQGKTLRGLIDEVSETHIHGNITNVGAIGSSANLPVITGENGVLTTGSFGTSENTFCQGNDSRLSDARTPKSHSHGNLQNNGQIGSTATTNGIVLTDGNGKITASNTLAKSTITLGSSDNTSKNIVTDANGKITTEAKYTHPSTHNTTIIKESSDLATIGTTANATQHTINEAINTKLANIISGDVDLSGTHTHLSSQITDADTTPTNNSSKLITSGAVYTIANPLKTRYDGLYFSQGSTPTNQYYRLFHIESKGANSSSSALYFEIYEETGKRYVKVGAYLRRNTKSSSTASIEIIKTSGGWTPKFYIAYGVTGDTDTSKTYADIYWKAESNMIYCRIKVVEDHLRDGTYTQLAPVPDGTECYASIESASTTLYNKAYNLISSEAVYNVKANSISKINGTSSEFLKADGSVDNSSYLTASNITGKADKTGGVAQVTDANANSYTSIGTLSSGATQQVINKAINDKIATLPTTDTNTTYGADRGISNVSGKFGHSNTEVSPVTTSALKKIKYDKYGHITGTDNVSSTDISGISGVKITDTTYANGTGITIDTSNGNKINHSNSVTKQDTQALYKIKHDAQGHITASGTVTASDLPNDQKYNNIKSGESTTLTLTNQKLVNDAINTKLGSKLESVATGNINANAVTLNKLNSDVYDTAPTENSDKLVTSKGVYNALTGKVDVTQSTASRFLVTGSDKKVTLKEKLGNITLDGKVSTSGDNNSKNVVTTSDGTITTEDKYSHPSSHPTTFITNSESYGNIGSNLTNQKLINDGVNDKLGGKIDVSQGSDNNGKLLKVSNGNVVCENVTSDATPLYDTINGSVGTTSKYSREDHTHPHFTYTGVKGKDNTVGLIKILRLTVGSDNKDKPIAIKVYQKGRLERSVVNIKFAESSNTLESFTHTGYDTNISFALIDEGSGNWDLCVTKGVSTTKYGELSVIIDNPNTNITTTKLDAHLSTLPISSSVHISTHIGFTTTERTKLYNIETNANNYSHPSYTARTGKPIQNQTPSFGGTATVSQVKSDDTGHVSEINDFTIKIPNTTADTSTYGLTKLSDSTSSNSTVLSATANAVKKTYDEFSNSNKTTKNGHTHTMANITDWLNKVYPVGSIYMNASNSENPNTLLGGGTWIPIGQGRVLLGAGTYTEELEDGTTQTKTYTGGASDGSKNAVAVSHSHRINAVSDGAFCVGTGDGEGNVKLSIQRTEPRAYTTKGSGIAYLYDKDGSQKMIRSTDSNGESGTDKNMPPYLVVYMWQRTG